MHRTSLRLKSYGCKHAFDSRIAERTGVRIVCRQNRCSIRDSIVSDRTGSFFTDGTDPAGESKMKSHKPIKPSSCFEVTGAVRRRADRVSRRHSSLAEIAIIAAAVVVIVTAGVVLRGAGATETWSSSVTVKVSRDQTLWGIARSHPIEGLTTAQTVAEIRSQNSLVRSELQEGQLLQVPGEIDASSAMASR